MSAIKHHHIIGFAAENVKRLKAINLNFGSTNGVVEVTGENEQGKSSLLDSIEYALSGKKSYGEMPIRAGETKAKIVLKTDRLTITRTITAKEDGSLGGSLNVEDADGLSPKKPHDFLTSLCGDLSFDPIAFSTMSTKDQVEILKTFVKDFDFAENTARRLKTFNERKDVNRDVAELKMKLSGISIDDDTPESHIDVDALIAELQEVGDFNLMIDRRQDRRDQHASEISAERAKAVKLNEEAADLYERARLLTAQAEEAETKANQMQEQLDCAEEMPAKKDAAEIRSKISEAQALNAKVDRRDARDRLANQLQSAEENAAALTQKIDDIDDEKRAAIANSDLPVKGFEFDEDKILLDGIPFSEASQARKIRTGLQLCVAANPGIRIVLIRNGAFLDKKAMASLEDLAREMDVTIFVETVDSNRPGAIVIEDGSVKEIVRATDQAE